jgi:hypothetical protein
MKENSEWPQRGTKDAKKNAVGLLRFLRLFAAEEAYGT